MGTTRLGIGLLALLVACSSKEGPPPRVSATERAVVEAPRQTTSAAPPRAAPVGSAKASPTESQPAFAEPPDRGVTAAIVGSIGDCIEPSLAITDLETHRRYALLYNACVAATGRSALDVSGLDEGNEMGFSRSGAPFDLIETSLDGRPVGPARPGVSSRAVAIRGTIRHDGFQTRAFDIEIDFDRGGGRIETRHLVGVARDASLATNE